MRIAWFRPESADAPLIAALRATHDIDVFPQASAHEFVWRHARQPFDVCVHELQDTPAHDFIWAYMFHYPGVLHLRSQSLCSSRAAALLGRQRTEDLAAELAFSGADMVRAPALASRLVVVSDEYIAAALRTRYTNARVRSAPVAARGRPVRVDVEAGLHPSAGAARVPDRADGRTRLRHSEDRPQPSQDRLRVAVVDGPTTLSITRAVGRARVAGCVIDLVADESLDSTDVVISIPWPPPTDLSSGALGAMAAARAVIVLETEATASLPSLDPQTWRPRDPQPASPSVVVSLDPRDEEHSLMLALRRLAGDPSLGHALGAAAAAWCRAHASPSAAALAWQAILEEAVRLPASARPASWPAHLSPDGTEGARVILGEFGLERVLDW